MNSSEIEREIEYGDECTRWQLIAPACEEVEQLDETCSVCEPSSRTARSPPRAPAPRLATRWWGECELRQI